jgi:hypothetical protein
VGSASNFPRTKFQQARLLLLLLCRSVHVAVHRMMLQLLRRFPGSYLIRAQAGELRYLAAFTTPAAAAAWCLTVQVSQHMLRYVTLRHVTCSTQQ